MRMISTTPSERPLRTFVHRNGVVTRIYRESVETDLPLGPTVRAVPQGSEHQADMAARLGYAHDVDHMTRDHDLLHNLVADLLGLPCSFSVKVAAGIASQAENDIAALEEAAVLALQAFARSARVDLLML